MTSLTRSIKSVGHLIYVASGGEVVIYVANSKVACEWSDQ